MNNTFFNYDLVTDTDVEVFNAVPGTLKITSINMTDNGVVNIPETIDGLPVTYCAASSDLAIKKLIIPKTLVAPWSIEDCFNNVDELVIDKDNPKWNTDGISFLSKDGTKLLRMMSKNRTSYSIPDTVTTICYKAFHFKNIIELIIPDSVTTVEYCAFDCCHSLKTVRGGKNIINCGRDSFAGTEWFKSSPILVLGKTLLRFDSMDENIVVPEGIEVIGPYAFSCKDDKDAILESVVLPSTLKGIGDSAFFGKKNLKNINFPEGLQTIKDGAFYACQSLTEIVLPESISEIGISAFQKCSSITKVVIPHAVSGQKATAFQYKIEKNLISAEAFSDCTALKYFDIPEGTVAIGNSAFKHCTSLTNIRIPNTVKAIGDKAFANCSELKELYLPSSCVEIGQNIFPQSEPKWLGGSAKLSRIEVDPQNQVFSSTNGILCSKNGDTIIACPPQYNVVNYVVPNGVKAILPGAFESCEKIKKVVFSQSIESIGKKAFASMPSLEEIVLPTNYPILEDELFMECDNLKSITWPNNLRKIGKKCFEYTGIENLIIPETVDSIGSYAFSCIKQKKVRLPKTVKDFSVGIFAGVPEIEVYDTVDSEAKPATEHLDDENGTFNGKVGAIGISPLNGYQTAYNANWCNHTIIVISAEDDSEKYRVRMPSTQKKKVSYTFASSWGKNAEFNFNAIDNIFNDLSADAKLDYAFNRLHWQAGISEETLSTLYQYIARKAKESAFRIFQADDVNDLAMLEPHGIVKKNTIDERIEQATRANATKCKAWLIDWQDRNLSKKEKVKKVEKDLGMRALTVAEIKRIWPNKKGADGGLTIIGYMGKDVDVRVPEIIGKTPVTAIADHCFSSCHKYKDENQNEFLRTQLRSVEIPDSVVNIGRWVFEGCKSLESVKLSKNIKTISEYLFSGSYINSITIPASVESIEETSFVGGALGRSTNFESIEVEQASKHFKSIDGVLFSFDEKTLIRYPEAKKSEKYEIPKGVTKIAKYAFESVDALRFVTIPESVDVIDDDAFSRCSNLEMVSMPEKVSTFGTSFYNCTALKEIVVPRGVVELPPNCFGNCISLTKVSLPNGLKKIGTRAFEDCRRLSKINIPDSVRSIDSCAFYKCKALKDITIPSSTTKIEWGVFECCNNLTIHTPAGSKMYTYAKTKGIKVEKLDE